MLPPNEIRRPGHVATAWTDAPCRALGRGGEVVGRLSARLEPGGHGLELVAILAAAHGIGSRAPFCVWFAVRRGDGGRGAR